MVTYRLQCIHVHTLWLRDDNIVYQGTFSYNFPQILYFQDADVYVGKLFGEKKITCHIIKENSTSKGKVPVTSVH